MSIQRIQSQHSQQTYYQSQGNTAHKPETKNDSPDNAGDVCIASTDKVDGEIARLKSKESLLAQRLHTSSDSVQQRDLEEELARIENELRQKDNDTYRRQNTEFSSGVDVKA